MNSFLKKRLSAYLQNKDVVTSDFKTSVLSNNLGVEGIDFCNTRGNVRLMEQNVLTPAEQDKMLEEVLAYDFSK